MILLVQLKLQAGLQCWTLQGRFESTRVLQLTSTKYGIPREGQIKTIAMGSGSICLDSFITEHAIHFCPDECFPSPRRVCLFSRLTVGCSTPLRGGAASQGSPTMLGLRNNIRHIFISG